MARGQNKKQEGKLNNSLVLNRYMLSLFHVNRFEAFGELLKDPTLEGWDENNVSYFYHKLQEFMHDDAQLSDEQLLAYDQNIYRYTVAISEHREASIRWKYFQYLTLLFTEIYLDRYFSDRDGLLQSINDYKQLSFDADAETFHGMSEYTMNDLNKLAYWSATGSGKTLIMHVNYLQFKYYSEKAGKKMNRTLLITPKEGLTKQHLEEYKLSNIDAHVFSKQAGGIFTGQGIDVLEITKLDEKDYENKVAVDSFEHDNLVFVDEGHTGSGGDAWKTYRDKLSTEGFCFEYSATFGQSISAISNAGKRKKLLEEYGKATLFDYSYRYFYNDGYGKDYQILNLNDTWNDTSLTTYLTACLLNFYEQQRLYRDKKAVLRTFMIENPLAIFVGGSVTADKSIGTKEASDIVFILKFFQQFITDTVEAKANIEHLMNGQDGLTDKGGQPIFSRQFAYLRGLDNHDTDTIYHDMLELVFHCSVSGAQLHLDNLKGKNGEIGMRIGNGDYFGIINVGDSTTLTKKCDAAGINTISKDYAEGSLFATINNPDSKLNILIGSKKFTEGWSSWRVSTMGLLNVGRTEGSQIIQLFGRGVRLKGYQFSLKRSSALDPSIQPDTKPRHMKSIETLNIFGIKADYMEQFKQFLEDEGLPANDSDFVDFDVPIMPVINLKEKKLKYLKVTDGCDFKKDKVVTIKSDMIGNIPVTLDYYPKIQAEKSKGLRSVLDDVSGTLYTASLTKEYLEFIDWNQVYFAIVNYKNERNWYNLNVSPEELQKIARDTSWYTLYIPEPQMKFTDFRRQTMMWQDILITLLKSYVEKAYNNAKSRWMSQHVEVAYLDASNPNFDKMYHVTMHRQYEEDGFFAAIEKLKEDLNNDTFAQTIRITNSNDFEALHIAGHLYQPLLYLNPSAFKKAHIGKLIQVKPVALNSGERDFVCDIQRYYDGNHDFFADKALYLLRNKSKKGIGFFDTTGFYPDFIIWLVIGKHQYVSFIDPKGITHLHGFDDEKIQLHKSIRETIEPVLNDPDITLNSYIVADTELKDVKYWNEFGNNAVEESKQKLFNEHHVYFQKDQKSNYIGLILENMINNKIR